MAAMERTGLATTGEVVDDHTPMDELEELLEEPHELHEPVILGDQVVHEEQTLEAVVDEQDSIR